MKKKIFLQISLLLIILIISVTFFKIYFESKNTNNFSEDIKTKTDDVNKKKSNIIHNIQYIAEGKEGNSYIINSKFGEIYSSKEDSILLKEVSAIINLPNSGAINIYAKNAVYDKVNYNTKFYEDVLVTYFHHNINSDNLNLDFQKNLATIYNNITYKNLNTKLQADKIEIDLITKNSKISMNDKTKKIKIISMN